MAKLFTTARQFENILSLLKTSGNELFALIPKARTAKIVRNILELVAALQVPDSLDIQVRLCRDVVDWCVLEKRTFLKQRIEAKVRKIDVRKDERHDRVACCRKH